MLRLCLQLGKTPTELAEALSSEEFSEFLLLDSTQEVANDEGEPEMDAAEFMARIKK